MEASRLLVAFAALTGVLLAGCSSTPEEGEYKGATKTAPDANRKPGNAPQAGGGAAKPQGLQAEP